MTWAYILEHFILSKTNCGQRMERFDGSLKQDFAGPHLACTHSLSDLQKVLYAAECN